MFLTLPTQQEHNPGQNPAGEEEGEGQTRGEQKQVRFEACSFYSWWNITGILKTQMVIRSSSRFLFPFH